MKKLLIIICVLLVIFVGMYFYKTNINQENVTVTEVENIEEYISKIYMWREITREALPRFDNINDAPDDWIWEVVKKNLDKFELSYEEIQEKAIQIFGDNFKKQFPQEGTQYINYSEEYGKYITTGIGLDTLDDLFYIKNIKKIKNGYKVEIVEYLEDHGIYMYLDQEDGPIEYDVYIKNLNEDIIATVENTDSETKRIEAVKGNIDKFSTKTINLNLDSNGNIFVESVR